MKRLKLYLFALLAIATTAPAWALHGGVTLGLGYSHGYGHGYGYGHGGYRPSFGVGINLNPFPLVFGAPYYNYGYAPRYVYRSEPEIIVSSSPQTVYVERNVISSPQYETITSVPANDNASDFQPSQSNGWLYCHNPDGYYPAIKNCPGGWQKIAPSTPNRN